MFLIWLAWRRKASPWFSGALQSRAPASHQVVAQVGAILILSKPENREKLIYFMGIERVRFRRPVHPGDVVEIEAVVKRLRNRMGVLRGVGRVSGEVVVSGTMTFALGPRGSQPE